MSLPRPEYPRPQLRRDAWLCLNGQWQFVTDPARSGRARGLAKPDSALPREITVPFCMESPLSGIGETDFCDAVWYRREISLPAGWLADGRRVLLHVDACDWRSEVWVNGKSVGMHVGGYTPATYDITAALDPASASAVVTICAEDTLRSCKQPSGKQSQNYGSHGCFYTRTTGIWQSVWLESVPAAYIKNVRYLTDVKAGMLTVEATVEVNAGAAVEATAAADISGGLVFSAEAGYAGRPVGAASTTVAGGFCTLTLPLSELHLWDVGEGRLYDLRLTLGEDTVDSYFGMRSLAVRDGMLYINDRPVFQRLVLDQGFYPDGIYTAPTDAELVADIERSLACGFNGACLHQKIFEPRFLYHCDRLGYIVWGEHANWGLDVSRPEAYGGFMPEWLEALERDVNHPAIIGWCPLNETQRNQNPDFVRALMALTRTYDPTRPVIDASGWCHVSASESDIMDWHDYDQNPVTFRERYENVARGQAIHSPRNAADIRPVFVSEYGGIRWAPEGNGWGYGDAPATPEEFLARFEGLTRALLENPCITGLCYTQLTDVEQEVNGLYTYDRRPKFDVSNFRRVLSAPAASETARGKKD